MSSTTKPQIIQQVEDSTLRLCSQVGDIVSPMFGPRGQSKLVGYGNGESRVMNDATMILDMMCFPHPVVKMIADAGATSKKLSGDGTTTTVLLASALIAEGMKLRQRGLAPTLVASNYHHCLARSLATLRENSMVIDDNAKERRVEVAMTALSKIDPSDRRRVAEVVVEAVEVMNEVSTDGHIDLRPIRLEKRPGASLSDSFVVKGTIIDTVRTDENMPERVKDAKVALLTCPLIPKKLKSKYEVRTTSIEDMASFAKRAYEEKKEIARRLAKGGATVVVTKGMIDKYVQALLAKAGVFAIQEVDDWDLECLMKATGGKIVPRVDLFTPADLGNADLVEEVEINGDPLTVFRCKKGRAASILVRGANQTAVESAIGSMTDALFAVRDIIRQGKVVAGGGAAEMQVVTALRRESSMIDSSLQSAMQSYANAVESVVRALCANSSLDLIDSVSALRLLHLGEENPWLGFEAETKSVVDTRVAGILHPLEVLESAFISATEAACAVLRISHILQCPPRAPTVGDMRAKKLAHYGSNVKLEEAPKATKW
jgi:archaeal chaperonin